MVRTRIAIAYLFAVACFLVAAPAHAAVPAITITVNSVLDTADPTPDNGVCNVSSHGTVCTLRAAIQTANGHAETGRDTIRFVIGTGPKTISPSAVLPDITDQVVIDGTTQPAASGSDPCSVQLAHPCIELAGTNVPTQTGLTVGAGPSVVRGLVVNRFNGGIVLADAQGGDHVERNFVGTNPEGTAALANSGFGILDAGGPNVVIGGASPAQGNLVSGNESDGIEIAADSALVENNLIGTNADGTAAIPNGAGIGMQLNPSDLTIGAPGAPNVISGNLHDGILARVSDAVIQGNLIGTDATGQSAVPNGLSGIHVQVATAMTIGGTAAGAGNVVSGQSQQGILVEELGSGTTANVIIQGNRIGTNLDGTAALGNGAGIELDDSPTGVIIGGTAVGAGNLISGNPGDGIFVGSQVEGAVIQGNLIGTNAAGTAPIGNSLGIHVIGIHTLIGGKVPGAGNVVAGTPFNPGIKTATVGAGSGGNVIQGNFIGTDASGEVAIPNANGIVVEGDGDLLGGGAAGAGNVISGNIGLGAEIVGTGVRVLGNRVGVSASGQPLGNGDAGIVVETNGARIGGAKAATANRIASNTGPGILVPADFGGIRFLRNSIHDNGGLGIDLDPTHQSGDGVTANDAGDADTGPNGLQNFPVVGKAVRGSDSTTIRGTINSLAATKFVIRLYSSPECDPSGFGEGTTFLRTVSATTDATGKATFQVTLSTALALGRQVTATAMAPNGDTSEFSRCRAVTAP